MLDRLRDLACALLAVGLAFACGSEAPPSPSDDASAARAEAPEKAAQPAAAGATAEPERREEPRRAERPLPAFSGWTLDGGKLDISSFIGKRLVVVFFNPEVAEAAVVAGAVTRIAALRGRHNFGIVGVAVGSTRATATSFAKAQGLEFPVIDDSSGRITQQFGLRAPFAVLGVDADGYMVWGFSQFATQAPDAVERIASQLRGALRLPERDEAPPGDRPLAPDFSAAVLDQDEPFELAKQKGKPVLLIFFLHTCPHCHDALRFLKSELADLPEDQRPTLVGVEITGKTAAVRASLRRDGFDFFPVLFDDTGEIQADYGVFAGVPVLVLIDREGRIAGRVQGWRGQEDALLMRMRIAKLCGLPVPMLLRPKGYTGSEVCGVCHEREHETWQLTRHARAYDTLVEHGAERDPECVGCHVVGFGKEGGFQPSPIGSALENVGCESCHGRGGPHLSPDFVTEGNYSPACQGCHDVKHSLGFEYASFLPKISHAANAHILDLPAAERRRILAERGAVRKDLLPSRASHVGSEACKSCHPNEYATWAAGPHASALASLERKGKARDATCLACHTTGFGKSGGFPPKAAPAEHADLARVGCESCHGPGGDHVGEDAVKFGSIVSLGDKCDSCVILQICGSCHDEANDPGFEFEVEAKIDRIRHGTVEAGTGRPLEPAEKPAAGKSAAAPPRSLSDAELIARAFAAGTAPASTTWTRP